MRDEQLVEVYAARDSMEAHFVRTLLEDDGIDARVVGEGLTFAIGDLPLGLPTSPRVWVRDEDAERARELIDAWEASRQERREREQQFGTEDES
jgi:hypothetical protein